MKMAGESKKQLGRRCRRSPTVQFVRLSHNAMHAHREFAVLHHLCRRSPRIRVQLWGKRPHWFSSPGGRPRGAGEAGQRTGRASRSRRITHRRFGAGCPKSNLISGRLRRRLTLVSQAVRAVAPSFLSVSSPSTPHSSPSLVSPCPYERRQATCEARYRRPIRPRDLC